MSEALPDKNPYKSGSVEWQLFEGAKSNASQANAWAADAERFREKSQAARETAAAYREALETLARAKEET